MNWAGNYEYRAPVLFEPRSVEEVQDVVAAASRITALGSTHSFNDIADSLEAQVSVRGLPPRLDIDESALTVTVSAGARYGEFVEQLHDAGWAIPNLASLPHISVAGAIATGTHGSGNGNGTLASAVAAIEFVGADGSLGNAKRGDADFDGMIVALGALGVLTAVGLDIQPTFDVRQDIFENLSWAALESDFDAITGSAYSVSLFTNWGESAITTVWLKSRMDGDIAAAESASLFGARKRDDGAHPLPDSPKVNTTQQGGIPGPWWNRLAHFKLDFTPSNGEELQSEYLVPRQHAIEAIAAVRALEPIIAPHLLVTEIRTMRGDELWLSPAYGGDTVAIHFTWKPEDAVYGVVPQIEAALAPFGARPHFGKVFSMGSERIAGLFPRYDDFRMLAARRDPTGKFRNGYLDRTVFAR